MTQPTPPATGQSPSHPAAAGLAMGTGSDRRAPVRSTSAQRVCRWPNAS